MAVFAVELGETSAAESAAISKLESVLGTGQLALMPGG
jgi:hypothetical protein